MTPLPPELGFEHRLLECRHGSPPDGSLIRAGSKRAPSAEGASLVAAREEELAVQGAATDSQKA